MAIFMFSCKNVKNNVEESPKESVDTVSKKIESAETPIIEYAQEASNDSVAASLVPVILERLKNDLKVMSPEDHKFSYYALDMNGDNKDEYFINFHGQYFRGTGGGTILLLSHDKKVINNFTVIDPPLFRSNVKTNGWNDIILIGDRNDDGGSKNFIHLTYNKKTGKYPSNPSLIKKSEIAPGGSNVSMWNGEFSQAKEYNF